MSIENVSPSTPPVNSNLLGSEGTQQSGNPVRSTMTISDYHFPSQVSGPVTIQVNVEYPNAQVSIIVPQHAFANPEVAIPVLFQQFKQLLPIMTSLSFSDGNTITTYPTPSEEPVSSNPFILSDNTSDIQQVTNDFTNELAKAISVIGTEFAIADAFKTQLVKNQSPHP